MVAATQPIAMVDAFGPADGLVRAFNRRNRDCVHVDSRPDTWIAQRASYRPQDFIANIGYQGDLPAAVESLRALGVSHVCTPFETGVILGDQIAQALGVDGNSPKRSAARRNKFLQTEAVRSAGLPAAKQGLFSEPEEALRWRRAMRLGTVVVKAKDSAGTDAVFICDSEASIRAAFEGVLNRKNKLGYWNNDALVMEFLEGDEYVVDLVASEHARALAPQLSPARCVAVWRYRKERVDGVPLYRAIEILPSRGPVQDRLVTYVQALTSQGLDVRFGPSHTEVIWQVPASPDGVRRCLTCGGPTPPDDEPRPSSRFCSHHCFEVAHGLAESPAPAQIAGTPVLVECGTRLHGGAGPRVGELAVPGRGQVEMTAEAVTDPLGFHRATAEAYSLTRHAWQVFLAVPRGGVLRQVRRLDEVRSLPSFVELQLKYRAGDRVEKTVDVWTEPGYVVLAHPDRRTVERDYQQVRRWDASDLWDVG